jgi:flagellar L-ring protein precursor FlgH
MGKRIRVVVMVSGLAMCLMACSPLLTPTEHYPAALPVDIPPPPKTHGTIFQPGYETRLFTDKVAFRIGDVLTVRLEESTTGQYKANTKTSKTAALTYPIPTFFGQVLPGLEVKTNTSQEFDGKGNSDESNKLNGTITVTVIKLLSNNNMVIQGESWVTIDQGQEYVQLTGMVRPEDIQPNNVISSQRVANAKITYGARGQAGYASSGGLLTKLFNRFAPY